MLKTYRIIPLVFILFLFGFTLITVAPVLAQSTQDLESRISALEEVLCSLHPEAGTEKYSVCDVAKQRGREGRDSARQINRAQAEEAERVRQAEARAHAERSAGNLEKTKANRAMEQKAFNKCRQFPLMSPEKMECEHKAMMEETPIKVDRDKDPFTYGPDGFATQSPDGLFRCVGYPEIRENPDEPKGVAYAKCMQKFDEAKR